MKHENINQKAFKALKEAVAGVIAENEELGLPLWISENGRVVGLESSKLKHIKSIKKGRKLRKLRQTTQYILR